MARRGSIAAAQADLGLSHPAVRRHLARFEKLIGSPLFSRSQAGVVATPIAEQLIAHAEAMERAATMIMHAVASGRAEGRVVIGAPTLLTEDVVPSILGALRRFQPGVRYQISPSTGDLLKRVVDVALGFAPPAQDAAIASRIATFEVGLYASRDWIVAHGFPTSIAALISHRELVGDRGGWEVFLAESVIGIEQINYAIGISTSDDLATLSAISAGLGVGPAPVWAAQQRNGLVRVLPRLRADGQIWMSCHPDLRRVPHVKTVMDTLRCEIPALLSDGG